jgi:hypothetical protein
MKTKLEHLALGLILGPVAPIIGFLGAWWGTYAILPEKWISLSMLLGLLAGILVDAFFLKRWVGLAYRFDPKIWMAIYLFYAAGVFGFFMGLPVFNAALAIPAGIVIGGKLAHEKANDAQVKIAARKTSLFTTIVLAVICMISASLALADPSIGTNLEGMFSLNFAVTPLMIWGIILIGGAILLLINWWLTALSTRLTYRFLRAE